MEHEVGPTMDLMSDELVDLLIDCRAAGRATVLIPGDTVADLIGELLRLTRTCDDLKDWAHDWHLRANARAAQVTYLEHLVEHQQRVLAYLNKNVDDPDATAVRIEADNLILFSDDTLRALADADSAAGPDPDGM